MPFIYSTISCDNVYPVYHEKSDESGPNKIKTSVLIKGGANVAQRRFVNEDGTNTPAGVRTEVTDEQLEILFQSDEFQKHVDRGFLTIVQSKEKIADVVEDMESKDASAQFTAADYEKGGRAQADAGITGLTIDPWVYRNRRITAATRRSP
jgi:hypothetical protein